MIPSSLFKYQPCNEPQLNSLFNSEMFFSPPSKFEDSYDCKIPAEITEESYPKLKRTFENKGYIFNEKQLMANASNFTSLRNNMIETHYRIYSLTDTPFSELHWKNYAKDGTGFCIEWDTRQLEYYMQLFDVKISYSKIRYVIELPEYDPTWSAYKKYIHSLFLKLKKYEWENEHRLIIETSSLSKGNLLSIHPKAMKAIYLGKNISNKHRRLIINHYSSFPAWYKPQIYILQ